MTKQLSKLLIIEHGCFLILFEVRSKFPNCENVEPPNAIHSSAPRIIFISATAFNSLYGEVLFPTRVVFVRGLNSVIFSEDCHVVLNEWENSSFWNIDSFFFP